MSNMLPGYATKTFSQIFDDQGTFLYYYLNSGIPTTISNDSVKTLYYLLYARYGNTPIANWDENQFKYKVFSIIWQYGPTWEKKLDIQSKLRALTDDDILSGSKAIHNHAYNPENEPKTGELTEIGYINDQNTTNYKKSKMDAYMQLWSLLATDVTQEFINRFDICFKKFAQPGTRLYVEDEEE